MHTVKYAEVEPN